MGETGEAKEIAHLFEVLFQAHPWHGIGAGPDAPETVVTYIEIVPNDPLKYELDKPTGHLRLDRPQRFSSLCPTLYGFIPQTYCGPKVAALCEERTNRGGVRGDGDPLDICVLAEKSIAHGNILLRARPVGGLLMLDNDEADDKLVAVLEGDLSFGDIQDMEDVPAAVVDRLKHYFLSYKQLPMEQNRKVSIDAVYGRGDAYEVIRRSQLDYRDTYGPPEGRLPRLKELLARGNAQR